jgi:hypothetical protein
MIPSHKYEPAIYAQVRERALTSPQPPTSESDYIPHVVLMDWIIKSGSFTVLAAADGTASVYLSSGGGYIGGSPSDPAIRLAALNAIKEAGRVIVHTTQAKDHSLPSPGEVRFYFVNALGVFVSTVPETLLRTGNHPFCPLARAMHSIITNYRLSPR